MKYEFQAITHCNMCGASSNDAKILGKRLNMSQGMSPYKKAGITTTIMRCNKCDLIYANPLPIPYELSQHYGTPAEDYWNEDYFNIDPEYFQGCITRFKQLYDSDNVALKALDIGAGIGKAVVALNNAGFDTYAFEPSESFYEKGLEVNKLDPEKFSCVTLESAEYKKNTFDFITFGAVLEHLYDPSMAILKAMDWLKIGGLMQIEVPSSKWLTSKIINSLYRIRGMDYVTNLSPMHSPFHIFEFGMKSFQFHAENNDYSIAHSEYLVCNTHLPRICLLYTSPSPRDS